MESEQNIKEKKSYLAFLSSLGVEDLKSKIIFFITLFVVFISAAISFFLLPPIDFPADKMITIEKGTTLSEVSNILYREKMIRSKVFFEICSKLAGGKKPIVAGEYIFKEPTVSCSIATRIARGISGIPAVKITIPEGMSNVEMAAVLEKNISQFDRNAFFETLWEKEGFLFPDTYFFRENASVQTIGDAMLANFDRRIEPFEEEITASGHSQRDIIIMASILEKEAVTAEDRAIISGILWKRIKMGMPLQVDATFMYLLGKKSNELTLGDLEMKSAYNTYTNKGLPYGPIGNPGIDTIVAAIHPVTTPYLYYLSDDEGVMHYAKTFEEHKANKLKYLR